MQTDGDPGGQAPGTRAGGRRADAERNRARILEAAQRLYAEEGLGIAMAAVAREAGVGKATMSRHFASPQELIEAVFVDRMDAYVRAAEEALSAEDGWEGFTGFVWAVCGLQASDRGFADVLTLAFPGAPCLEERRERAYRGFLEVIARARASGRLREDFEHQDMVVLMMANAGVVAATANDAPDTWRRLVGQVLRAWAVPEAPPVALPSVPSDEDLYRAMGRGRDTGGG